MSNILVTYFSAEGTTKTVAEKLAAGIGADLFEIKPVQPYTKSDLNWTNPLARCNREKVGKKDVPVEGKIENFDSYDIIFVGFPIWYYGPPNVIATFAKDYDFTGKKVALFATSGGSPIGKSEERFLPYMNGKGILLGAKLFAPDATEAELRRWAEEL